MLCAKQRTTYPGFVPRDNNWCPLSAIAEAAIIGPPHVNWGEIPFALVVLKEGVTIKERALIDHVKKYIGLGLLPRDAILMKVKFVAALDRTSVGKINKVELRNKHLPC